MCLMHSKLFTIPNQEPPNTLSSYLSNQRGKILNTVNKVCIMPPLFFFLLQPFSLNLRIKCAFSDKREHTRTEVEIIFFGQSCRNFQLQSLCTNTSLWMCQCSVLQLKYQGFLICFFFFGFLFHAQMVSKTERWKWLNYKKHFGLSRFYIKRKNT